LKKYLLDLKKQVTDANSKIDEVRAVFLVMRDEYAPEMLDSVMGNGSEAEKRVETIAAAIKDIEKAISREVQDWDGAYKLVNQSDVWLKEIEGLLSAIGQLKTNIENAKREVKIEIGDAKSDIDKALAYIKQHDADIDDGLEDDLKAAEGKLQESQNELRKSKPHYIKALKLAREANSKADRIFEKSVEQHEYAERQRKQAVSLLNEAERSIDTAESYINNHRSDVEQAAKSDLQSAQSWFWQARQTSDIKAVIERAKRADDLADSAYAKAKRDVSDAEDERDRRRRAAEQARISSSFSSSNSSHSSNWGSSRGGGGSSNWGSSRGGGGGSTGW